VDMLEDSQIRGLYHT